LLVTFLVSLAIFVAGAVVGYASIGPIWAADSLGPATPDPARIGPPMWVIVVRNTGALMLLYSGVLTLGVTSLLAMVMVSGYIGATMAVAVWNQGLGRLFAETGMYAPIEFAGLVLAAGAGLYPTVVLASATFADRDGRATPVARYLDAVRTSLKILACGFVLIVVAAAIEALVLALR
jgi:uncharacterized membrane protein SpoIIM required for sporulation